MKRHRTASYIAVVTYLAASLLVSTLFIPYFVPYVVATATPTPTPTLAYPTPTPIAVPTPYPVSGTTHPSGLTHFGWIAPPSNINNGIGGRIVQLKATKALTLGCPVSPDPSFSNQVVASQIGSTNVLGIVVGSSGTTSTTSYGGIGIAPGVGQTADIQVNGIVPVTCDSTILQGTNVMISSTLQCAVTAYSAGTADEEFGTMLQGCTDGTVGNMLLLK